MKVDYSTHTRPGTVLVLRDVTEIFPEYRPVAGQTYQADICRTRNGTEFCVIPVGEKQIVLRRGKTAEYIEVPSDA